MRLFASNRYALMYKKVLIMLLLVTLTPSFSFHASASGAGSEAVTYSYDFHKLGVASQANPNDVQGTQEGFSIIEHSDPIDKQPFGIDVEGNSVGSYIKLSFTVPQAGSYYVKFSGFKSRSGGMADIEIDGNKVGEYSFSADSGAPGSEVVLGKLDLSAGNHELKLVITAGGDKGSHWYYMYPTSFKLDSQNGNDDTGVTAVTYSYDFHKLGVASQANPNDVQGTQEGFSIIEHSDPIDKQPFGIDVEGNSVGSYIKLSFTVPQAGSYYVKFSGFKSRSGGMADIEIDGNKVGEYSFSADSGAPGSVSVMDKVDLSAGNHELKLVITAAGDKGSRWYYMYPTSFVLDSQIGNSDPGNGNTGGSYVKDTTKRPSVFDFHKLGVASQANPGDVQETQADWSIIEHSDPIDKQPFGIDVEGNSTGSFIRLSFKVPETDSYNISFSGFRSRSGGLAEIQIDGQTAGEYSFSADAGTSGDEVLLGNVKLTAGNHELKLIVKSAGQFGDRYFYMYPTSFVLVPRMSETGITGVKNRSTVFTEEKLAAARANINRYSWASAIKDNAVALADHYLSYGGDEYWWSLVTPHTIPRSMGVITRDRLPEGPCPGCGPDQNKYGYYPWIMDPVNKPWKMTWPDGGPTFPTNDYGAYYKSGLDEHGIFNPKKADKTLLVNTLYPEKGEKWGVDDGSGWVDENGKRWTFIAYYNHFGLWYEYVLGIIPRALNAFREAYLYTGDPKYAYVGIILLDRIADVYPDMDVQEFPWGEGFDNGTPSWNVAQGKILNETWEDFLINDFAYAYDAFYPALQSGNDGGAAGFLKAKANQFQLYNPKSSIEHIKKNIEDGILREVFKAFKNGQMQGNFGMPQGALALTAVVLDEPGVTKEMLDYNFQTGGLVMEADPQNVYGRRFIVTGGDILNTLVNVVDRDGFGNEGSPGYNALWLDNLKIAADVLDGYRLPDSISEQEKDKYDLYKNVKFRKMFYSFYLTLLGKNTPAIGDSGSVSDSGILMKLENLVTAFEKFGDHAFAQMAYLQNGNTAAGLHGSIFSENPEEIREDVQEIINNEGALDLGSSNLTGFGFTALRDGKGQLQNDGLIQQFPQLAVVDASNKEHKTLTNYNSQLFKADAPGQSITFRFNVPKNDEYEVSVQTVLAPIYGQYEVSIDGNRLGAVIDAYADAVESKADFIKLGKTGLTAGGHQITFTSVGKNVKNSTSDQYYIGLQTLILKDKEAQDAANEPARPDTQRDLWMYYGRNNGHGHKDTLNLGVHAFGMNLAPDLGYPDNMGEDPKRYQWVSNTISHNTVVVDSSKQKDQFVGTPLHFDDSQTVKLMDIAANNVYPQTEEYRRTTAMIQVDEVNSYGVDFFRVMGGNDHHFSFHGPEAAVSTEGLNLQTQTSGTYAGPDIAFGQRYDSTEGGGYSGSGFHYLKNVRRDSLPSDNFSVDWKTVKDSDVHLKLTMLGDFNEVALADGEPPKNPSNPDTLTYLIAHRNGSNLNSLFTSVIEPYKGESFIKSVTAVALTADGNVAADYEAKAVRVELKNGRTDYIVTSVNPEVAYTVDNKFQFKGFFGVYSVKDGMPISAYANDAERVGDLIMNGPASISGTVQDFTKDLRVNNEIVIKADQANVSANELIGKHIYIENDGNRNASYAITDVKNQNGNLVTLSIGDITPIRGWADSEDFSKGFVYDFAESDHFVIPLSVTKTAKGTEPNNPEPTSQPDSGTAPVPSGETAAISDDGTIKLKKGEAKDGLVQSNIPAELLDKAYEKAAGDHKDVIEAIIQFEETIGASAYRVNVPAGALSSDRADRRIRIRTSLGEIVVPSDMLTPEEANGAKSVGIQIAKADKSGLSEELQSQIGNGALIELHVFLDGKEMAWRNENAKVYVSIKHTPSKEQLEKADHIVVWGIDNVGKAAPVPSGRYAPLTGSVEFTVTRTGKYAIAFRFKTFSDISDYDWARNAIEALAAKGVIDGTTETTFLPGGTITRAEFIMLLIKGLGLHAKFDDNFIDIGEEQYYFEAAGIARKLGISSGIGGNTFDPAASITRQDMMVMVERALRAAGKEISSPSGQLLTGYSDAADIAEYARESVAKLVEDGLIQGDGMGLNPLGYLTRAESAVLIYRLYNK